MDEMEQKLGAILGNPDLMKQIMSMAQSLGQSGVWTRQRFRKSHLWPGKPESTGISRHC